MAIAKMFRIPQDFNIIEGIIQYNLKAVKSNRKISLTIL